jgi:hypothetical protein
MYVAHAVDRFATGISIGGEGLDRYCFSAGRQGQLTMLANGREFTAEGNRGYAYHATPGTRFQLSDNNTRVGLWIDGLTLRRALECLLEEPLRRPLDFGSVIAWDQGLAATLMNLMDFMSHELQRWPGEFGQVDKWNFCLRAARMPRNRRYHDETSAPDAYTGFQGKGGVGCHQG